MNGAVRIAALTTVPASSRTTTHHRSNGAPTSAHESVPDAISRAVRELTLAITLPRTGSAASRSPATSRNGCGVVKNSSSMEDATHGDEAVDTRFRRQEARQ